MILFKQANGVIMVTLEILNPDMTDIILKRMKTAIKIINLSRQKYMYKV